MTESDVLAAMDLPTGSRVNRRVPKTLWPEPLRSALGEAVEELRWLAVLKPETCAIEAHPNAPEIQILALQLRAGAKLADLGRLHRAIPYPVFALVHLGPTLSLSLREASTELGDHAATTAWLPSLTLARQNRDSLSTVYAGWTAAVRRLAEPCRIADEMTRLRAQARNEKRIAEVARINLRLEQLKSEFAAAREALCR